MTIAPGSRLGPYEITAKLGAGGMGDVYRATDAKLKREVAIKVLPPLFNDDPERMARFEREAQLLAQLHHSNIASIFGLEESNGIRALVMELVEGEDLSQTIKRGPLPLDEALSVARQIAEALHFAHEQGIVHRDLKPGNVRLRPDGAVKVLDFGLAKAMEPEPAPSGSPTASPALMNSPTLTSAGTQLGVILGTAAYMSPEQAKGRGADRRSDVWSFGCVLFEMLAGRRAFEGEDATDVLAAVVRGEPDWQALPPDVPREIRVLLERCLVKDRARRLPDMGVACFLLSEQGALAAADTPAAPPARPSPARTIWFTVAGAAAAALVTLGLVQVVRPARSPSGATRRAHLSIELPDGVTLGQADQVPLATSSTGTLLAYVGTSEGKPRIYLRKLDDPQSRPLDGTEGARTPFFSPDDAWIGFFAEGKLKKISTTGAALQVLAEAPDARGGAWGTDGNIYYAPTNIAGIWRVPEAGGAAAQVTRLDHENGEISHRWPQVLPDRRTLLYDAWTGPGNDECAVVVQSIDGSDRRVLVRGANMPLYLASRGLLLYTRLDDLFAVPWTPGQRGDQTMGSVVPLSLAEHPRMAGEGGNGIAIANDGTLAYVPGGAQRYAQRVVWIDAAGQMTTLPLPERPYQNVAIAPDGTQAMVQIQEGSVGLWTLDLARGTVTPFSTGAGSSQAPVWTPDGKRVVYRGTRRGLRNLFWKAADGTGEEERLSTKADVTHTPTAVTPDGRWLLFQEQGGSKRESRLFRLRLDDAGDRTPQPLHNGAENERNAHPSPDGRWLAYESSVSGRLEVYVEPLAEPGPRRQVSTDGGTEPAWARDGRALFYRSGDRVMRVEIAAGSTLAAGTPRLLYSGRFPDPYNWNTPYDVAADGRFLRAVPSQLEHPLDSIDVVLNWSTELDSLLGGRK